MSLQLPTILTLKFQIEVHCVRECMFWCFTVKILYSLFPDLHNTHLRSIETLPLRPPAIERKRKYHLKYFIY